VHSFGAETIKVSKLSREMKQYVKEWEGKKLNKKRGGQSC